MLLSSNGLYLIEGLWDSFLEMRIKLQKSVTCVNQLPRPTDRDDVITQCGDDFQTGLAQGMLILDFIFGIMFCCPKVGRN